MVGRRVLVIEDNATLAKVLVRYLNQAGYTALGAPTCENARNILQSGAVDIIVLDIQLPDWNGLDFLDDVKHLVSGVRTVLISADDISRWRQRAKAIGVHAYLKKPFALTALKRTVECISNMDLCCRECAKTGGPDGVHPTCARFY